MANVNGADGNGHALFHGVFFAIIPSPGLGAGEAEKLVATLELHGATHCSLASNQLRNITHLVSTTSDFPAYHDAVDGFIHVVKPSWVEQSVFKKRAANPRQYSPDPRLFLSDVVITCAEDIPRGDKDAIIGGVQAMGGQYSPIISKLVTHVVALSMNNETCASVVEKKLRCKPVLPHWFDACLKLGKKIDHTPYVLPDPPILSRDGHPGPLAITNNEDLQGASQFEPVDLPQTSTPPASPSKDRKDLGVFNSRKIMLHKDLDLSAHLKESLADLIRKGGGDLVTKVDQADILVCRNRENPEFKSASLAGKDVGNLNWLYHLINHNSWTSPTRRLLHYPYPKDGIPGFDSLKITISNYTGEARVYLESLAKAAGAVFTKSMMPENTHLITAHAYGEKCVAAKEWGIQTVNHLWLEESYARCKIQAVTSPRYTTFPEKTNLGEVIGQTQIDREEVEKKYFPRSSSQTKAGQLEPIEPNRGSSRTPLNHAVKSPPVSADVSGGSRSAKNRALDKLHSMAPDIALYQKESKRTGGVVYGGRRVNDPDRIQINRKRNAEDDFSDTISVHSEEGEEAGSSPIPNKKQRKLNVPQPGPPIKVLLTGWTSRSQSLYKQKAKPFGVTFTDDPMTPFQVLAAPKLLRTKKFLCGIAQAPTVVHIDWLTTMLTKNERPVLQDYLLEDKESEAKFDLTLEESLSRAKTNKDNGGMLKGWAIFCTEKVGGGFETYEEIVRVNGGQCHLFKGRETTVKRRKADPPSQEDGDVEMSEDAKEKLHLITVHDDKKLWGKFRAMAESQGFEPIICTVDWILRVALSQDVEEWRETWELNEDET